MQTIVGWKKGKTRENICLYYCSKNSNMSPLDVSNDAHKTTTINRKNNSNKPKQQQKRISSFFTTNVNNATIPSSLVSNGATLASSVTTTTTTTTKKRKLQSRNPVTGSHFQICPICQKQYPFYQIEIHASECTIPTVQQQGHSIPTRKINRIEKQFADTNDRNTSQSIHRTVDTNRNKWNNSENNNENVIELIENPMIDSDSEMVRNNYQQESNDYNRVKDKEILHSNVPLDLKNNFDAIPTLESTEEQSYDEECYDTMESCNAVAVEQYNVVSSSMPIPGLYVIEEFITVEEEKQIIAELDGTTHTELFLPWRESNFNGKHTYKRWGVHCDLRSRRVSEAENPLPNFMKTILIPKIRTLLRTLQQQTNNTKYKIVSNNGTWIPNEANAIDYYRKRGDSLKAHVDDRKLSKEIIANLSLVGKCYMTFTNVAANRTTGIVSQRVLLNPRCLQLLTGPARYDFSHAIANHDLLSDRRISVTMRQSPLSTAPKSIPISKFIVPTTTSRNPSHVSSFDTNSNITSVTSDGKDNSVEWWKKKPMIVTPAKTIDGGNNVPYQQPISGLFVFENFITEEEEEVILHEIDTVQPPSWSMERHSGLHREKRYGIDHDLWSATVRPPKYPLPKFMNTILIPKLQTLRVMQGVVPNDINIIDYHRNQGHYLTQHVDDRAKHKEPIANISLAGDCYMTFTNQNATKNQLPTKPYKVHLKQRTLFIMTGRVRYDFSHGIDNKDLLSDRRVSVTMRETTKLP